MDAGSGGLQVLPTTIEEVQLFECLGIRLGGWLITYPRADQFSRKERESLDRSDLDSLKGPRAEWRSVFQREVGMD